MSLIRMNFNIYEMILEDDHNLVGQLERGNLFKILKEAVACSARDVVFSSNTIVTPSPVPDSFSHLALFTVIRVTDGSVIHNDAGIDVDFSTKNSGKYYNIEVRATEVLSNSQIRNFIDDLGNTYTQSVFKQAYYGPDIFLNEGSSLQAPITTTGYMKLAEVYWDGIAILESHIKNVDSNYGEANTDWTNETSATQLAISYLDHRNIFDHPDESVELKHLVQSLQDLILSGGATNVPSDNLHGSGVIGGYGNEFTAIFIDSEPLLNPNEIRLDSGAGLELGDIFINLIGTDSIPVVVEHTPTDAARSNQLDTRVQIGKVINTDYEVLNFSGGNTQQLQRYFNPTSGKTGIGNSGGTALGAGQVCTLEPTTWEIWDDTGITQYSLSFDEGGGSASDFDIDTSNGEITKINTGIAGNVFQIKYVYSLPRYDTVQMEFDGSTTVKEGTYSSVGVPQVIDPDSAARGIYILLINPNETTLSVSNIYSDIRNYIVPLGTSNIYIDTQQKFEEYFGDGTELNLNGTTVKGWAVNAQGLVISGEILDSSPDGLTESFNGTTVETPVAKGSLQIGYIINGIPYIATDDSNGAIIGTKIDSATINYLTGDWSITFDVGEPLDSGTDITGDYVRVDSVQITIPRKTNVCLVSNPFDGSSNHFKYSLSNFPYLSYILKTNVRMLGEVTIKGNGIDQTILIPNDNASILVGEYKTQLSGCSNSVASSIITVLDAVDLKVGQLIYYTEVGEGSNFYRIIDISGLNVTVDRDIDGIGSGETLTVCAENINIELLTIDGRGGQDGLGGSLAVNAIELDYVADSNLSLKVINTNGDTIGGIKETTTLNISTNGKVSAIKYNQAVIASLSLMKCVYWNTSTEQWEQADFTNTPKGILVRQGVVALSGDIDGFEGLTPGVTLYMDSSGNIVTTPTTLILGRAEAVDKIDLAIKDFSTAYVYAEQYAEQVAFFQGGA